MLQELLAAQAYVLSHVPYLMIGAVGLATFVLAVETVGEFLEG